MNSSDNITAAEIIHNMMNSNNNHGNGNINGDGNNNKNNNNNSNVYGNNGNNIIKDNTLIFPNNTGECTGTAEDSNNNGSNNNSNVYVYGNNNDNSNIIKDNTLTFPNNTGECMGAAESAVAIAEAGRGEDLLLLEIATAIAMITKAKSLPWHSDAIANNTSILAEAIGINAIIIPNNPPLLSQVVSPQVHAAPRIVVYPPPSLPSAGASQEEEKEYSNPDDIDYDGITFAVDDDRVEEPKKKKSRTDIDPWITNNMIAKENTNTIAKKKKKKKKNSSSTTPPGSTGKEASNTTTVKKVKKIKKVKVIIPGGSPYEHIVQNEAQWKDNYDQLVEFYHKNGNSNVLRSNPNKKLSGWVKRQ
jgi:hypothetical protein